MVLDRLGPMREDRSPLRLADVPEPHPARGEVRLRVQACGVCHTELDEIEGRTPPASLPRILGHQVVGTVDEIGADVDGDWLGAGVGVAWIFSACGACRWCRAGRENLCPAFVAAGRDVDGGYAEYMVAPSAFVHRLPDGLAGAGAAPLLCAGAIGLRSLDAAALADGEPLGLTGFGASGHLVLSMARVLFPKSPVYVFARNPDERALARQLGAAWTGDTQAASPDPLAAIIDTTPVWTPIVRALGQLAPGGRLVVNAIRKEDVDKAALLELDYPRDLWREKSIRSVANVTRADVRRCLDLSAAHGLRPQTTAYALDQANEALASLKRGAGRGARVLVVDR
jgi:propanol-preferring alcohol dehydrogenase